ncbi:hypothetical protein V6N13_083167 [Hibiscus sabdariffa]|uniref:Transmembrane protein n=1 Tax=Hibiscus sabdariffa TaxID=183260 RepID=A0ABR2SY08_9ROSI
MACKISPTLSILVLLLSLSVLQIPSSSATTPHFLAGKKINQKIGITPPCHHHAGGGIICRHPHGVATQTQDHN